MNYLNSCMFLSGSKSYILNCPQSSNYRNGNYMCEKLYKMNFAYFDCFLSIISSRTDRWRWCHLLEHLSFCRCRFYVAVSLVSNRSQEMSKYGKNISEMLSYVPCATYLDLPRFDVICDLLVNRRTETWELLHLYLIAGARWANS